MKTLTPVLLALTTLLAAAPAVEAGDLVPVRFEVQQATQWGESVYLLGNLSELGADDPTRAIRMVRGDRDRWSVQVGLPAGARYTYRYVFRWNAPDALGNASNLHPLGPERTATAPGVAQARRVRVRYFSGFEQVHLRYLRGVGDVAEVTMQRAGPGRRWGEYAYEVELDVWLPQLAFICHDGRGNVDRAPGGEAYATGYRSFALASGQIHPGPAAADSLRDLRGSEIHRFSWWSDALRNRREIAIYLPRGYWQSSRRYPVLYMHDGQNVFGPDAVMGGWRVELSADAAIAAGQVEDVIVVGVGNTAQRMGEYVPEADGGQAARYARFLIDEIKPWVDGNLRTRPEREHTGVAGSSLGGLAALYLGLEYPHVFGKVASLSGSFWLRDWAEQMPPRAHVDQRVWLDSGSGGHSADSMEHTYFVRDELLRMGFVLGRDLQHTLDHGATHTERFWRARIGDALRFLFPAE